MFCNFTKISNPADIDYCHFNLELTIDDTIMSIVIMLLKIATYGTKHIIMEFLSIFNAKLRLIRAKCYLCSSWLLLI